MIGLEAGIDGVSAPDAAKEQGGGDQAQQRESNLAYHERVGEAESSRAPSCRRRFFFQSRGHVGAGSAQRRGQPEQGGRDEGNEHRKPSTPPSNFSATILWMYWVGTNDHTKWHPAYPRPTPATQLTRLSSALSVSNCRINRPRLAPIASRSPISCRRAAARASSRLATFEHAKPSTSVTTVSSTALASARPLVPPALKKSSSAIGRTRMPCPSLLSGYSRARAADTGSRLA